MTDCEENIIARIRLGAMMHLLLEDYQHLAAWNYGLVLDVSLENLFISVSIEQGRVRFHARFFLMKSCLGGICASAQAFRDCQFWHSQAQNIHSAWRSSHSRLECVQTVV
jgi:hypothetical protein